MFPGRPSPRIYAHRGASATHRENTVAAFAEALRLGVHGIELDVRATSDGVPVVSHDAGLARALGIDREIAEMTAGELLALAPEVPTLAEVLTLVDGRCHLDVEIKVAGLEAEALAALGHYAHDRWAISSFDWDVLREVRGLDDRAELWVLCLAASPAALEVADAIGATTLAVEQRSLTPEVVAGVRAAGRAVMAWTVNDPNRATRLGSFGVAAVCTDDPAAMLGLEGNATSGARPGPRPGRRGRRGRPGC